MSWMFEVWKENHLVSDSNCNIVNPKSMIIYNPPKKNQGMINNVGLAFSVGNTTLQFTISIEQDNFRLIFICNIYLNQL